MHRTGRPSSSSRALVACIVCAARAGWTTLINQLVAQRTCHTDDCCHLPTLDWVGEPWARLQFYNPQRARRHAV
jgi:hypothetical protein